MMFLRHLFQEIDTRARLLANMCRAKSTAELPYADLALRELATIEGDANQYMAKIGGTYKQSPARLTALGREYHRLSRDLGHLEEFLIGHLAHLSDDDRKVSAVARWLWAGFGLPGSPPLVIASTSGYYNTVPRYNVVFTPVSAAATLLTIPDALHEFGHLVHGLHRSLFGQRFRAALQDYLFEVQTRAAQIKRPLPDNFIERLRWTWTERWAQEIACDTFATRFIDAAYGWCNLALCMKRPEVHTFTTSHPADSFRTANIHRLIRRHRQDGVADDLDRVWNDYCGFNKALKPPNYDDFHSVDLAAAVIDDVYDATSSLSVDANVRSLVNELWKRFAQGDPTYKDVEAEIYNASAGDA